MAIFKIRFFIFPVIDTASGFLLLLPELVFPSKKSRCRSFILIFWLIKNGIKPIRNIDFFTFLIQKAFSYVFFCFLGLRGTFTWPAYSFVLGKRFLNFGYAPELFDGGACHGDNEPVIDGRIDICALWCVLFAVMYGASPFDCGEKVFMKFIAYLCLVKWFWKNKVQ